MKDGIHPSRYTKIEHKKQTNADRIRAMSDEELAKLLADFAWDNEPSVDETFKWLQSEVEG